MKNAINEYYDNHIVFTEHNHLYTFDGVECTSATTILGTLEEQFDEEFHSKRMSIRDGVTQASILKLWADKRDKAGFRGTGIHRYIECKLLGIPYDHEFDISKLELKASEDVLMDLVNRNIDPYGVEVITGSKKHLICGMVDFIGEILVLKLLINESHRWKIQGKKTS